METIENFYKDNRTAYQRRADNLRRKIHLLGTMRLVLAIGLIGAIWIFKSENWSILSGIVCLFILPFIVLMIYHTKLAKRKGYAETMVSLCENELKGLNYDFSAFDGASEKISAEHPFSIDLDLFGEHSFFQSINRTVTWMGKEKLAGWFLHPLTDKKEILERQDAIRELETFTHLRFHFYVTGKMHPGKKEDQRLLEMLTSEAGYFNKNVVWKILIWLVPAIWIVLFVSFYFGLVPLSLFGIFFAISFVLSYIQAKKVTDLHNSVNKMEAILNTYSELMKNIEGDLFKSKLLMKIGRQLSGEKETASCAIKRLSRYIGALDQRVSAIGIILNIFMLRDTRMAMKLERWKEQHAGSTREWFEALSNFDALCSLSGFAFNHPDYIYPEIAETYFKMEGHALGHPLLPRDRCVKNNIDIEKSPSFLIITGANMAGKSTYLRTVGINYVLACIGAPVCADTLTVYPARLITSLRTSDSLAGNESYFFAELKRLKMIIDRLKKGEKLFIILDEILKGTNSVDKQKGSVALMKQLISFQTCGIIATHDLVLGELEKEFPGQIRNFRFEADITEDELTFSYRLRPGVAQNMNACFLMKKMGITV